MAATNPGILNGTNINIYIDEDNTGTLVPIANATSGNISINQSLRDASNKDDAPWAVNLEGQLDWSVSVEALMKFSDSNYDVREIYSILENRGAVMVAFSTEEVGDTFYRGFARVASLSMDAPLEDNATISAELTGSGALSQLQQT